MRILPTICDQRCSVRFVGSHSVSGSAGSSALTAPPTTNATSSMAHQLQSSPGSAERKIGWPSSAACRLAWRFGDESQQPIFPHVSHMRR